MRTISLQFRLCGFAALMAICQPAYSQGVQLRHWFGQGISPAYEGYDTNPDGTFNMWFGYMNRNYEQEPDVPVGPENAFQPGPADRGQPTHFLPRRHKDVFSVTVPKDFGDKTLIWTITANGDTQKVTATLAQQWMIDRKYTTRGANIENPYSNTPPVVRMQQSAQSIGVSDPLTITIAATDDGLPKRQGKTIGMNYAWGKYRGPGTVVFTPASDKIVDGKAVTTAKFSAPGDYILQVVVDDGSGENAGNFGYHCCWTNAQVKVSVK
jgi:hypothetical protein